MPLAPATERSGDIACGPPRTGAAPAAKHHPSLGPRREVERRKGAGGRGSAAPAARERYKRPFDVAVLGVVLVLFAPLWLLLWAGIALSIRLEGGGPVFYRQTRLGRGGAVFSILKFRTMVENAEDGKGPVLSLARDRRTTRTGRVLRRFHLDELPQAVNILKGEMSLVGPRPERPELAARFERTVPGFADRLRVRPGVAGLAQAVGVYNWDPARKLRCDNFYIARMNPCLDLRLCVRCLVRTLESDGGSSGRRRRRPTS